MEPSIGTPLVGKIFGYLNPKFPVDARDGAAKIIRIFCDDRGKQFRPFFLVIYKV